MHKLAFLIPSFLLMTACDKLPFNKEKKENIASVASAATSNNLAATVNTVKNPCLNPVLIQGVKQGILEESKKITSKNFDDLKLEAMLDILDSSEITFENITNPEQAPLDTNQKICNATAVVTNLGADEDITQDIQYQSKIMYRENGESNQGWQASWGNLPIRMANTAYSSLLDRIQQQKKSNQSESQQDIANTSLQPKNNNLDERQTNAEPNEVDENGNIYQEIVNEENKQKNSFYVVQVMEIIDRLWKVPNKSQGQSLVASFKVNENGGVSDISFQGEVNEEFEESLRHAIELASPLPPPPNGARTITGNFKAK